MPIDGSRDVDGEVAPQGLPLYSYKEVVSPPNLEVRAAALRAEALSVDIAKQAAADTATAEQEANVVPCSEVQWRSPQKKSILRRQQV